uniref:Uncharacterized protein At2g06970 n=1 Tax=Arabidopsis thaliana TaxID=3702 RepID=Q9ZVW4_ARATH|nr:hypothetical protein [Arabidopsis thaliana]
MTSIPSSTSHTTLEAVSFSATSLYKVYIYSSFSYVFLPCFFSLQDKNSNIFILSTTHEIMNPSYPTRSLDSSAKRPNSLPMTRTLLAGLSTALLTQTT